LRASGRQAPQTPGGPIKDKSFSPLPDCPLKPSIQD
jgi:hypothetical protein